VSRRLDWERAKPEYVPNPIAVLSRVGRLAESFVFDGVTDMLRSETVVKHD